MTELAEVIRELAAFDSATVSNAIERTKTREFTEGFASLDIRCQYPELPPMVGVAVTCTHVSTSPKPPETHLHDLIDAVGAASATGPVVVVCQYVGDERERGCFIGDMIATLLQRLGGAGVVTDTGVRDLAGIRDRAPGFQVFSPGTVASHGRPTIVEVGTPVRVGGLEVRPGDLIHGDVNGVVSVPPAAIGSVVDEARHVLASEAEVIDLIGRDPLPLDELKERFFRSGYR